MCKRVGLHRDDFEDMTIGMCLDFVDEYIDHNNPKKQKARKATQGDFDSF